MTAFRPTAPKLPRSRSAFSLVEVIMAMGIISFCLVALTGLLSVCLNSSRDSTAATADTLLFEKVVNQLRVITVDRDFEQPGDREKDQFLLPALGSEGGETEFTVDLQMRYLGPGVKTTRDASKVVQVKVLNPTKLPVSGAEEPRGLSEGGKVAYVQVTIQNAMEYKSKVTSLSSIYSTELSLLTE